MAILYDAELRPSKLELIAAWLPTQDWYDGPTEPRLDGVASYRFDDPAGEVGIETHLVRTSDGVVIQVPLTYRGAPLAGAEQWLVGTMDHSVLGQRWVYDAVGDPVYTAAVTSVIDSNGTEAEQFVKSDEGLTRIPNTARVAGTGGGAANSGTVTVVRRPESGRQEASGPRLEGRWDGLHEPVLLVVMSEASV
ncbi:MAG: hypothetical protein GX610_12850 [Rhodococcus sp.]|nr:hypothetical protein [Rhodococcus sp. (in: high G+C Gram-positive bacteria)]